MHDDLEASLIDIHHIIDDGSSEELASENLPVLAGERMIGYDLLLHHLLEWLSLLLNHLCVLIFVLGYESLELSKLVAAHFCPRIQVNCVY